MSALSAQKDLLARGWTSRKMGLALDETDEYGPSTHWINCQGGR